MSAAAPDLRRHRVRSALTMATVALLAGLAGGLIAVTVDPNTTPGPSSATAPSTCPVTGVAERDLPSVVTISARDGTAGGTGSGEILRPDGDILTNNHVVAPAAGGGTLTVLFADGKTADASIVGRDPATDLAVIRASGVEGLPAIELGTSRDLRIGQQVIALGSPLGLSSTVTSGIVSALDRTVSVPGESSPGALLIDAIQTDAAINPGNSGGALVDCAGRLVGVPSAGASVPTSSGESGGGSIGLGFAIPIDLAKVVADEIIATGKVTHAYLGLGAEPLSANDTRENGVAEGLLVASVDPSGPAAAAGVRAGDVITSIDRQPATSTDQLVVLTLRQRPGDTVSVDVDRAGRRLALTIRLAARS